MSQPTHRDLEGGNDPGHRDHPQSTPNQALHGEANFGDSSGPLFSMYSKAAEDEDNKMVERWQKDADGILIFTGLFSAAVAAFLSVTVQDLRPNSQDTSAFYLGNIYEALADPNLTRAANPPPFSPPRYAVWVNLLWFLSLVMGLSCALLATSLHQWARRYIRLTQPARCSPEKRARMRGFFANGVDRMHIPWAVEGLPTLLHLSLFLFFAGLIVFLFNVNQEVFTGVVWWIGLFSLLYGLITFLPLIWQDSPYYTPLSKPAWFPYASLQYLTFTVLIVITFCCCFCCSYETFERCCDSRDRYRGRMLRGVEKIAEETASEESSEIDVGILGWTISALGDDHSLEKFFEAIPGFFNSKLVVYLERDFPETLLETFWSALNGFMGRTLSSDLVPKSVKSRRVVICRDIMSMMPCSNEAEHRYLRSHFDQAPVSIERLQAMAQWFTHLSDDVSYTARIRAAKNLARIQERDGRWIALASELYGLSDRDLRHNVALGGDNTLLATVIGALLPATLIDATPAMIDADSLASRAFNPHSLRLVGAFTQFDIHHTLPGLQHDFCTLWNELVQKARRQGPYIFVNLLREIRHLYIALHQGTDAAPTAFSATGYFNPILDEPSSYPLCDIASHRPDSIAHALPSLIQPGDSPDASPHHSNPGDVTVSTPVKDARIITGPPSPSHPMTLSKIGDSSHPPAATLSALPDFTSPSPTDVSPPGTVAAALQDIPSAAPLPCSLEGSTQQDIVVPCAESDISEIQSTASIPAPTPTLTPVPASTPPILNTSLTSCDADAASISTSNPLLSSSSVVRLSVPASLPPSRVPPVPDADFLTLLGSTTPSRQTGDTTLPRLRARGLVNTGSMCYVNAVLQLLVSSPPFWNLFRELGGLKGQRGAGSLEIRSGKTPLVDAMVRFFEEFMYKEKEPPPIQQPPGQDAGGKPRKNEEEKKENQVVDSFEPTYMYDAMKEKRQLMKFLDGKHEDAEEFLYLYLDALDEELVELHTYINKQKPPSKISVEEVGGEVQSAEGQTEVGERDYTASSVASPMSRLFGGRSRSTIHAPNQPDAITVEDWRSLRLNIQPGSVHTIQDALAHVSQHQPVQVGQSSSSEPNRQVLLEVLPPVLVLRLERFVFDDVNKFGQPVQLAPELEIPLKIMVPVSGETAEPVHYKLYGVLYHNEDSTGTGSGHYTVDVLHRNEDKLDNGSGEAWLYIDDEVVSAVRHEDVFGRHDNERVDDRYAYMLFYCRTTPAWT